MTLPPTTPAAAIGTGATEPSAFLGRQPILDRNQQLVGYELLYRADATASEALVTDDGYASLVVVASLLQDLGADHAINYRTHDFVAEVGRLTGGKGVNEILDMVGGDYIARNLKCLALEGRLVQIAFLQPSKVDVDWMPLMLKRLTFTGSTLRARPAADKARLAGELQAKIWPHLAAGRMLPVINKVFDLGAAADAHRTMESSEHIGKLMLKVAGE